VVAAGERHQHNQAEARENGNEQGTVVLQVTALADFLFNHTRIKPMAAHFLDRFPAAVRAMAAGCKFSFALRPGLPPSQPSRLHLRSKEPTRKAFDEDEDDNTRKPKGRPDGHGSAGALAACAITTNGSTLLLARLSLSRRPDSTSPRVVMIMHL
jgi:hypothetical protein